MPSTFIWTVPRDVFDHLNHLAEKQANGYISEAELVEQMRSYGFPTAAAAGDHIHIRFVQRLISAPNTVH